MNRSLVSKPVAWLLLGILSAASMTYYVAEIWGANQPPHFSDLYAPWWAAHELLRHGRNPYSPEVAHEIQTVIYGAPSNSNQSDDPSGIVGGFAYPPYAILLLWPTVYLTFSTAQKVFLIVSAFVTLLSLALWLRMLRFRPSLVTWLTIALFFLGSFPTLQAVKLQNLSLIAAALIAVTLFLLSRHQMVPAGIFLAASTFKPQFTVVLIPWLALWTMSDWRERRSLCWSFLGTMLLLLGASEWMVSGWISSFWTVLGAYRHYTYGHSLLDVWFTPTWALGIAISLLLSALTICWRYRLQPADSTGFIVGTSLLLALTLVVIPTLAPHAQLLLLPGFLCLTRGPSLLPQSTLLRLLLTATWALLSWSWIAAVGLFLAGIALPLAPLVRFWAVPLYTSPLLPLVASFSLAALLHSFNTGDRDCQRVSSH